MVNLSERTALILARLFRSESARMAARELLTSKCGNEIPDCEKSGPEDLERIRFAALKISNGDFQKLKDAVGLANLDWRDLFMEADFGHDVDAHNKWYSQMLGTPSLSLVDVLRESWGWIGLDPVEVAGENDFGNLVIKARDGKYWRLCPEELSCRIVAGNRQELDTLSSDQEFLHDWYMKNLVTEAKEKLGPLADGDKYCLKIPSILGGEYGGSNLAIAPLVELVRLSGDIASQIKDLPDGAKIELKVTE